MQNLTKHLASKELPEMQLANNANQNWGETCGRRHYGLFPCTFKFEKLGGFSKNTLENKTRTGKGIPRAVVLMRMTGEVHRHCSYSKHLRIRLWIYFCVSPNLGLLISSNLYCGVFPVWSCLLHAYLKSHCKLTVYRKTQPSPLSKSRSTKELPTSFYHMG